LIVEKGVRATAGMFLILAGALLDLADEL